MNTYDRLSQNCLELDKEIDTLTKSERQQLTEAMKQIRLETARMAIKHSQMWFKEAILPVLQHYAEVSESVLELREMTGNIIEAAFRNQIGYDIPEDSLCMKMVMGLAVHTEIGIIDNEVMLTLTFDCTRMLTE